MAEIKPFRGIRPAPEYVSRVAALPYDVYTSAEARKAAEGNPYSFLHIDRAEIDLPEGTDPYSDEVYEKAASNLNSMIADKVFIRDDKEVFYIYSLVMNSRRQTGLVACASVDENLNGTIKKHELTRADKEVDRIKHVSACNANTGPIFLTYRARAEISDLISSLMRTLSPIYDFVSEDGVSQTVWLIDGEETVAKLKELFSFVPSLYIADGHHRNASAVHVAQKRRAEDTEKYGSYDKSAEYNYYLAVLFPDNELNILDYNRLVKDLNSLSKEEFLRRLAKDFIVSEAHDAPHHPTKAHNFGMYLDGKWYSLELRGEIDEDSPISRLDVSILQSRLLEPILGIRDLRTDKRIDFVGGIRGLSELERRVNSGEMRVAFVMYPTSVSEMIKIADENLIMPPKSTWFEPKLRSGIFIHSLS